MQPSFSPDHNKVSEDTVGKFLYNSAHTILVGAFGLLPLFIIPISFLPFDYSKILFISLLGLLAILFLSLSALRSGVVHLGLPLAGASFLVVGAVSVLSSLLSGDIQDSLMGELFGVQTAFFILMLAIVCTLTALFRFSKTSIMSFYLLLTISAVVLAVFHVSRIFLGADFLSLGLFPSNTDSPIGGWNDLALFFGLTILLSLVALEQLPLTRWGRVVFIVGIVLSLIMLSVINFFAVWIVLAIVSLIVLMYGLTKDKLSTNESFTNQTNTTSSLQSMLVSGGVFALSLLFIIAGGSLGGFIADSTQVSYIEVRPSFEATIDIARNVYTNNGAFLGIGPNKFIDAWRLYKDPSINQTIFWDTAFMAGNGYIPTLFVTTGIVGTVAWLTFFFLFVVAGLRMLFRTVHADRFWYFIGSSAFVAAVYLWGMSFIYTPGATILLLAAFFTSVTFTAYKTLVNDKVYILSSYHNKRGRFVLIATVIVIIVSSITAGYYLIRHYSAVHIYGTALTNITEETDIEDLEEQIVRVFDMFPNDAFARQLAEYQLSKVETLAVVEEPTEAQQQVLQNAIQNGISAAQLAIEMDPTEPRNWSILGQIYSFLAGVNVDGAKARAQEAFETARVYAPHNPSYYLLLAQLNSRTGDLSAARTAVMSSIGLKNNYTDALFFLAQLEISEGNTQAAIATAEAIISLEPNNPARYYLVGVLYLSDENADAAIVALERAVALDTSYANARYYLAIAYAQNNRIDDAITQLEVVLSLNPGNEEVSILIDQLKETGSLNSASNEEVTQVDEPESVSQTDGRTTTTQDPDTPLVAPVNTVGAASEE